MEVVEAGTPRKSGCVGSCGQGDEASSVNLCGFDI